MKRLTPLSLYVPSPVLTAMVLSCLGSEPVPASVNAKEPFHSPWRPGTRYFCYCSSVPYILMASKGSRVTVSTVPALPEILLISSMAMEVAV